MNKKKKKKKKTLFEDNHIIFIYTNASSIMHLFLALVTLRMLNNVNTTTSFNIKQMKMESGNLKMNKGTNPSIFATWQKLVHHRSMNHVRNSSVSVSHDRGK